MNELESKISNLTNDRLCEIIVANRYIGIMQQEAIECMKELAKRRGLGNVFNYEMHIETLLSSLPKINLDLNSILKLPKIL